jgi:hypothetical protein
MCTFKLLVVLWGNDPEGGGVWVVCFQREQCWGIIIALLHFFFILLLLSLTSIITLGEMGGILDRRFGRTESEHAVAVARNMK